MMKRKIAAAFFLALAAPGAVAALPVATKGPVSFDCTAPGGGDGMLTARFYETNPAMVLLERGGETRPAFQVPAASGAKYEGDDVLFWDAHGEASLTWSGAALTCRPRR